MCDSDGIVMESVGDKVGAFKTLVASSGDTPIFAFFFSETCGYCTTLMRYFADYRRQCVLQRARAIIVFINARTAPDLFRAYSIGPVPHTIVFKSGRDVKHISGADAPALACAMRSAGIQLSKNSD